jgi:hypothetical protein
MGVNPRVIARDTVIFWDHVPQRLPRGLVIDVPPGSALEAAIGADRLAPLGAHTPLAMQEAPARGGGKSGTSNGPQVDAGEAPSARVPSAEPPARPPEEEKPKAAEPHVKQPPAHPAKAAPRRRPAARKPRSEGEPDGS